MQEIFFRCQKDQSWLHFFKKEQICSLKSIKEILVEYAPLILMIQILLILLILLILIFKQFKSNTNDAQQFKKGKIFPCEFIKANKSF